VALRSAKFREVVQQVTAALEDRGISVPEPGVAQIVEERARQVAGEMRMTVRQVLEYADPQQLAARIAELIHQGEFAVRPPRDTVPVQIVASRIPALIGAFPKQGSWQPATTARITAFKSPLIWLRISLRPSMWRLPALAISTQIRPSLRWSEGCSSKQPL
jgi:hypothetical protein